MERAEEIGERMRERRRHGRRKGGKRRTRESPEIEAKNERREKEDRKRMREVDTGQN